VEIILEQEAGQQNLADDSLNLGDLPRLAC